MRNGNRWWIIVIVMVLLDWYVFSAIRHLSQTASERSRVILYSVYWTISAAAVLVVIAFPFMQSLHVSKFFRNYLFAIIIGIFFAKLITAVFLVIDDLRRGGLWVMGRLIPATTGADYMDSGVTIGRNTFLSWAGLIIGGSLFGTLIYGFTNKYAYEVRRLKLQFPNLPDAFRGLKIVQISDIHSGSFQNKQAVSHGIDMLLAEKPDVVFFTGDLVNDRADEMRDYMDVFSRVKAPMGVFSTLGNHDYGDYVTWPSVAEKTANLERLKQVHGELGWRLLMNEHVTLERGGQQIAVIGIENWGMKAGFPKYGRMDLAYPGTEKYPFKILLSHDPSHWDAEVRVKYPDIDLALAGHTHGMQFGVELPHFKWSPVKWVYKEWAGLYTQGKQQLYVNRGYGFIGYPGRVGIMPEITVIELA